MQEFAGCRKPRCLVNSQVQPENAQLGCESHGCNDPKENAELFSHLLHLLLGALKQSDYLIIPVGHWGKCDLKPK